MFILLSSATFIPKYFNNYDVINMMMMILVLLREFFWVYICYVRIFSSIFQGGVKVLITGSWQEDSSSYTCLFDQISVPASLIQPGVLRCYCPGNFTLQWISVSLQMSPLIRRRTAWTLIGVSVISSDLSNYGVVCVCSPWHRLGDSAGGCQ